MARVYKYLLEVRELQNVLLPKGARILSVQVQNGVPVMWAMADPDRDKEVVAIGMCGTGHDVVAQPELMSYIGTVQIDGFVWHYFRVLLVAQLVAEMPYG